MSKAKLDSEIRGLPKSSSRQPQGAHPCLFPHNPLRAQTRSRAGRGQLGSGLEGGRRGWPPYHLKEPLCPPRSALGPARPAPLTASSSPGVPGTAHLSGGSVPTRSPPPRGAVGVWGTGGQPAGSGRPPRAPRTPPLAFSGSRPRETGSPCSPALSSPPAAPCSDSHRFPRDRNGNEAPRPHASAPKPAGAAQDAARTARLEGVGKGGGGIRREWARRPLPCPP